MSLCDGNHAECFVGLFRGYTTGRYFEEIFPDFFFDEIDFFFPHVDSLEKRQVRPPGIFCRNFPQEKILFLRV